ncbi:MAG TPA: hypothetical protein VGQ47_01985 [Candidatus Limnocylindrales bacterium]|nr:hypothetical protein [Candidatus Limnocylindrales bacterium]
MRRTAWLAIVAALVALVAPAAARASDAPGRCPDAAPLATGWYRDAVGGPDADWLRFSLDRPRTVVVTLGGLSADARLRLFGGCGTLIATSDRKGAGFEEIVRRLPAGSYRVGIDAVAAAPSITAYGLRVRVLPQRVVVLSSRAWIEGPNLRIVGEVLNATGRTRESVSLRFIFYDAAGEVIPPLDWHTVAQGGLLGPRQRSMFVLDYAGVPAEYAHYGVLVESAPIARAEPIGGLPVERGPAATDESGTRVLSGTLRNGNPFPVRDSRVGVTLYDDWGRVLNADFAATRSRADGALAASGSDPFTISLWSHWADANRIVFRGYGERVREGTPGGPATPGSLRVRTD